MALFVGVISQKGGVGKSTICRMIAALYSANGWDVKIADLDTKQGTCTEWKRLRDHNAIDPVVSVETFRDIKQVQRIADNHDMILFDGAPHSSKQTLEVAQTSHIVILPTGPSLDDLRPSILLAHELTNNGITSSKIFFALCRVGDSVFEIEEARQYIKGAGYQVFEGEIPERVGYRRASDRGLSLLEVPFKSLKERIEPISKDIVDQISKLQRETSL
jgi:chromosome partitioning protein